MIEDLATPYLSFMSVALVFYIIVVAKSYDNMAYISEYTYTRRNVSSERKANWLVNCMIGFVATVFYPLTLLGILLWVLWKIILWFVEIISLSNKYRRTK